MAGAAGGVKKGRPGLIQWARGIALSGGDAAGRVGTAGLEARRRGRPCSTARASGG